MATFRHRPAPRVAVILGAVLLALVVLPGLVIEPERMLRGGGVVGIVVFLLFELGLLAIALRGVDVTLTGDTLELVSRRWPFAAGRHELARSSVLNVMLQQGRRRTVRVALGLQDGTVIPLTRSFFGRSAATDRDLEALAALLGVPAIGP